MARQSSNLAGYYDNGLEDVDYFVERLGQREEIAQGRGMITTDDGKSLPFTLENVAEKIREGFKLVNVNYKGQRTAKMYSYLTKQNVQRQNTVYAPVTISPLFNPAIAGRNILSQAIIQSISTSFKNILGQSANLEEQGVNLKVIGGGGIKTDSDFVSGGGRVYQGGGTWGGTRVNITGGANATQTINK